MCRCPEQGLRRALLDHAALVEHRHFVAQVVDHRQIVADEQVGDPILLGQILHQVEHLGLHRYIERADWFVCHDQARAGDECARNRHPLALAT